MLSHTDLRKGVQIVLDGEPYEVLEAAPMKKAQRRVVIQTRVRNLITGSMFSKNFHQGDTFEEAEIVKFGAKFIYSHRERFFFTREDDPVKRFDLGTEQVGKGAKLLKSNQVVETLEFQGKIINVSLPIKVQLRVTETPPGLKGERSQPGTKTATLETGAVIQVPLFIKEGDTVEVNTQTGEYTQRVE